MQEQWDPVPNYENLYSVSNLGNIRSENPKKIKKQTLNFYGYYRVTLTKNKISKQFFIHSLVAWTFIGKQEKGIEVRHINGIKSDNRVINLCYGTKADNMADAINHGTFSMGSNHPYAKLSTHDVINIVNSALSYKELAVIYNIHPFTIHKIRRGQIRRLETEEARKVAPKRFIKTKRHSLTEDQIRIIKDITISQRKAAEMMNLSQRAIFNWRKKLID